MSTMQLEFSQAMSDFKIMFPDMDREVIEAVLRANQGSVDSTIDQLLAMSTDNQNEKLRNELDAKLSPDQAPLGNLIKLNDMPTDDAPDGGTANSTSVAAANSVLLNLNSSSGSDASPNQHSTGASPKLRLLNVGAKFNKHQPLQASSGAISLKRCTRRWNPPLLGPLPPSFLRINAPNTLSYDGLRSDFDLPDEQFAIMLQNEEFMNQLRWNQEFMSALEKEQSGKTKSEDDAAFKERLKNMGKMSRKKFLQIARVFTWQRNKKITTAKQIDSLPLKEEPSDDEDHQHQNSRNHQQPQNHQSNSTLQHHYTQKQEQLRK